MNLQTFSASTMAEALTLVKGRFGPDAMILHTRTVQRREWLGLRRREVVEVTAGPASDRPRRNREQPIAPKPSSPAARPTSNPALAAYAKNSNTAVLPQSPVGQQGLKGLLDSPEMASAMVKVMTQEVTGLRAELRELVGQVRRNTATTGSPVPAELAAHYQQLIENQVAQELAEDLIKAVRLSVPPSYLSNPAFIREKIAEQLEKLFPVSGPIRKTKTDGPHVVALIGPTGVGKTTTIAKLAADLQLRESRRVGLITIDTYRIAAVDQLRRYADIIGSPLKVIGTPEDMPAAIASMSDCDYILIDTAGRSPSDSLKLSELRSFLDACNPDEVHLVLSTTSCPKSVDVAVAAFTKVRVDRILFTKIDEAASVGVILNVARKVGKALSYVTTGQDVPDDIEQVHGRKLARLLLGNLDPAPVAPQAAPVTQKVAQSTVVRETLSRNPQSSRLVAAGGLQ